RRARPDHVGSDFRRRHPHQSHSRLRRQYSPAQQLTTEPRMNLSVSSLSVAEHLADRIGAIRQLPPAVRVKCEELLIDVIGLCVTARNEAYIASAIGGWDDDGPCTAIGHGRTLSAAGAAFVNGTAAHGEDFDDTFEGGPVHAGAVIVPAVLAACERHHPDGPSALIGIAVGVET